MRIFARSVALLSLFILTFGALADSREAASVDQELLSQRPFERQPWVDERGMIRSGGFCASREYSPEEMLVLEAQQMDDLLSGRLRPRSDYSAPTTIRVHFHVIMDGNKG